MNFFPLMNEYTAANSINTKMTFILFKDFISKSLEFVWNYKKPLIKHLKYLNVKTHK